MSEIKSEKEIEPEIEIEKEIESEKEFEKENEIEEYAKYVEAVKRPRGRPKKVVENPTPKQPVGRPRREVTEILAPKVVIPERTRIETLADIIKQNQLDARSAKINLYKSFLPKF